MLCSTLQLSRHAYPHCLVLTYLCKHSEPIWVGIQAVFNGSIIACFLDFLKMWLCFNSPRLLMVTSVSALSEHVHFSSPRSLSIHFCYCLGPIALPVVYIVGRELTSQFMVHRLCLCLSEVITSFLLIVCVCLGCPLCCLEGCFVFYLA